MAEVSYVDGIDEQPSSRPSKAVSQDVIPTAANVLVLGGTIWESAWVPPLMCRQNRWMPLEERKSGAVVCAAILRRVSLRRGEHLGFL